MVDTNADGIDDILLCSSLFSALMDEPMPKTHEYVENRTIRGLLMEDIRKAMGEDMADKVSCAYSEYEVMECERYFRHGIRLALELLCL